MDERLIQSRKARSTGTEVDIVKVEGGYETICYGREGEPHGGVCFHFTLATARMFAPVPAEWCPYCQDQEEANA